MRCQRDCTNRSILWTWQPRRTKESATWRGDNGCCVEFQVCQVPSFSFGRLESKDPLNPTTSHTSDLIAWCYNIDDSLLIFHLDWCRFRFWPRRFTSSCTSHRDHTHLYVNCIFGPSLWRLRKSHQPPLTIMISNYLRASSLWRLRKWHQPPLTIMISTIIS